MINIKNDDNDCFKWCLKYHQTKKVTNDERISRLKKVVDIYNYDGIEMPMKIIDINKFEEQNKTICVNVFESNTKAEYVTSFHRIYESKNKNENVCNLLLVENNDESHYTYIKDISKCLNNSNQNNDDRKKLCPDCGLMFDHRYNHKCSAKEFNQNVKYSKKN